MIKQENNVLHYDKTRKYCVFSRRNMATKHHFLSADAKLELPELGRSIVQLYNVFAAESAVAKSKMWKGLPKLHLFQHMCEWQAPEYGNPRFWWCYADEDFVGQFIDVAESCHPKTLPVISIWKWLILIFEEAGH